MNESTALQKKPDGHSYTHHINLSLYQCNDCGATARTPELVVHYETCVPGESERWAQYYNDALDDEEEGVLEEEEEEYGGG